MRELAIKLAKMHCLEVPIQRDDQSKLCSWMKCFDLFYEQAFSKFDILNLVKNGKQETTGHLKQLIDTIKPEIEWMKNQMLSLKSPIVFAHNDFAKRNILYRETVDGKEPEEETAMIDYEYSSYTHRASDFGCFFSDFGNEIGNALSHTDA